jgi:hypothetical protein
MKHQFPIQGVNMMTRKFAVLLSILVLVSLLAPAAWAFIGPEEDPPVIEEVVAAMTAVAGGADPAPLLDNLGERYCPCPEETATPAAPVAGPVRKPVVAPNQDFVFAGGTFNVTRAESRTQIAMGDYYDDDLFEEDQASPDTQAEFHVPKLGKFLVVYFTFRGDEANLFGSVDPAMFHVKDAQGGDYTIAGMNIIWDLAEAEILMDITWLMWDDPYEMECALVFDVPEDSSDFELLFVPRGMEGTDPGAIVDLRL